MERLLNWFTNLGYAHLSPINDFYETNHEDEQDICKAGTVLVLFEETE